MEKKQTYLDFNPTLEIKNMPVEGISLEIFDKDGNSVPFLIPSREEINEAMHKMLAMFANTELRTIVFLAERFEEFTQQTLMGSLQTTHELTHNPDFNKDLDEDKLCDGVFAYLTNTRDKEITPENSSEVLLKNFFHQGAKPN